MKKLSSEDFINAWLIPNHGITVKELIKKEPKLVITPGWYKKYAVTQKAHDEWYDWAIKKIAKNMGVSLKRAKRLFVFDYLNLAPAVNDNN